MENLGPLITSLQPTPDALLRLGPVLVVKVKGALTVHQLTAAQQALLDHSPALVTSPHEVTKCSSSSRGGDRRAWVRHVPVSATGR
jgi:hypothetical protein